MSLHQLLPSEALAVAIAIAMFGFIEIARRRQRVLLVAQTQMIITLGIFVLLAILAVGVVIVVNVLRDNGRVTLCEGNESAIAAALQGWETQYGAYPASAAIAVKAHAGATAGTFSAPGFPATDLLASTPVDPVNPAANYTLTVVAATAAASESYTILCPGPHPLSSLASLSGGGTATKGQIQLQNGTTTAL